MRRSKMEEAVVGYQRDVSGCMRWLSGSELCLERGILDSRVANDDTGDELLEITLILCGGKKKVKHLYYIVEYLFGGYIL